MSSRGARIALGALFFLSGAAAVGAETVWLRWFRTLFGATAPAASATLVAFFAGHAVGAALAARHVGRIRRPVRAYGALEIAAAAAALGVPFLLLAGEGTIAALYAALGDRPAALATARFAVALAATFPAAACFGATLPVLGAAVVRGRVALGRTGAAFYAANTGGAALGAALATFVLPAAYGVPATYAIAVGATALAGASALAIGLRETPQESAAPARVEAAKPARQEAAKPAPRPSTRTRARTGSLPVTLAALSGFAAFATQVLLVSAFSQVLNGSVYAFGAVLVTVLVALALGAALVSSLERWAGLDPRDLVSFALAAAAIALLSFPALLFRETGGLSYVGAPGGGLAYAGAAVGVVAVSAGPTLVALALLFPLSFALAARGVPAAEASGSTREGVGRILGRLSAVNTAGAVAGALAAPWLALPLLGLWPSFAVLGGALALICLAVRPASAPVGIVRDVALAFSWIAIFSQASPLALPPVRLEAGETLVASDTSAAGVVAVVDRAGERLLRTDNYSVLGGTAETVHQRRQGHLPLLLHPRARRVAYVGSATGISAGAVLDHPVEALRLVEIVPGVAQAARRHFADANRGVYEDPRTSVAVDDARNFFRSTGERYDLVIADLFVPWRAGTGALYTREHFEAVRARLLPDGVFVQWLPLYQLGETEVRTILATFLDAFPKAALFRGDFYGGYPIVALVGFTGAVAQPAAIAAAAEALATRGETDRWVTDGAGVFSLYVAPLGPLAATLADVPRNDDANARVEFLAAATHAGGTRGKEQPLVGLRFARFAAAAAELAARTGDDVFPDLPAEAKRAAAGGAALQAAGAFYVERRPEESGQALARATELLPPRLLRHAAADPTAADVWAAEPGAR